MSRVHQCFTFVWERGERERRGESKMELLLLVWK